MKICLITDLHIDAEGFTFNGINARTNFTNVLNDVVIKNPALIVLAGDLCNITGNIEIYQWVKLQMDLAGIPYCCIAGNHDNASMMVEVFHDEVFDSGNELFYVKDIHCHTFIFLDTSVGRMSDRQYEWLTDVVSSLKEDIIIFMHHPPILAMAKHMEPRYAFQQMETFQSFCTGFQHKKFHIFTGHYHFERTISKGNITTYISPSTYLQIDPDHEEFKIFNGKIGYREIHLTENCVITNVIYL